MAEPLLRRGPGGDYVEELWEGEVRPWTWSEVWSAIWYLVLAAFAMVGVMQCGRWLIQAARWALAAAGGGDVGGDDAGGIGCG